MEESAPKQRRIRLTGERFAGGRLPIDSLVELERYQRLMQTIAEANWRRDHPGEELPADFKTDVSLAIDRIEPGSADVYVVEEQPSAYVQYQEVAHDTVEATISAAYSGSSLPDLPPAVSEQFRIDVADFGSTLEESQSIEVYVDGADQPPVVISVATRKEAVARLQLDDFFIVDDGTAAGNHLVKVEESVAGRVTELDPENQSYRFESLLYGPLKGRYKSNPELKEDFKKVLDSTEVGPVVRLTGQLQYRHGVPWRFVETDRVEETHLADDALIVLAALAPGWGENGEGQSIEFTAIEAANALLVAVHEAGLQRPGVFPTVEGGVLLEWSSSEQVRSVEISPDAEFELFFLAPGSFEPEQQQVADLSVATAFATGWAQ